MDLLGLNEPIFKMVIDGLSLKSKLDLLETVYFSTLFPFAKHKLKCKMKHDIFELLKQDESCYLSGFLATWALLPTLEATPYGEPGDIDIFCINEPINLYEKLSEKYQLSISTNSVRTFLDSKRMMLQLITKISPIEDILQRFDTQIVMISYHFKTDSWLITEEFKRCIRTSTQFIKFMYNSDKRLDKVINRGYHCLGLKFNIPVNIRDCGLEVREMIGLPFIDMHDRMGNYNLKDFHESLILVLKNNQNRDIIELLRVSGVSCINKDFSIEIFNQKRVILVFKRLFPIEFSKFNHVSTWNYITG
jgi:hypothetical protein